MSSKKHVFTTAGNTHTLHEETVLAVFAIMKLSLNCPKITAIKTLRSMTGMALLDAKNIVEFIELNAQANAFGEVLITLPSQPVSYQTVVIV